MTEIGLRKVLEISGLPASVAWLDAHAGTVVSVLQSTRSLERSLSTSAAWICTHDVVTLRPAVVDRPAGLVRTARLDRTRRDRLTVCSRPDASGSRVEVWDLAAKSRRVRAFVERVHDAVPWRNRVVVATSERPWTPEHGAKVRIYDASLVDALAELRVNDAGYDVVAASDVVATSGIDLHLWRPDADEQPFALNDSRVAPRMEVGSCALSDDGTWVAVVFDRRFPTCEPLAMWLRVNDQEAQPVRLFDDAAGLVSRIAFAPDGSTLALSFLDAPGVRVYRTYDGELLGEAPVPGRCAVAWLDAHQLLIGRETLSLWSLEG